MLVRFDDLCAWHGGADINRVLVYVPEADRERLETGWCPKCLEKRFRRPSSDLSWPVEDRSRSRRRRVEKSRTRSTEVPSRRSGPVDRDSSLLKLLKSIPCQVNGCDEPGTESFSFLDPATGLNFVSLCPEHAAEARHREIEARMARSRATRKSWRTEPLADGDEIPAPERLWTAEEWEIISHGLVPRAMEDRWFWFVEDLVLHAHRSSSGVEVFEASFARRSDGYVIRRLLVTTDRDLRCLLLRGDQPEDGTSLTGAFLRLVDAELLRL